MKYISHHHIVGDNGQDRRKKELYNNSTIPKTQYIVGEKKIECPSPQKPSKRITTPPLQRVRVVKHEYKERIKESEN